MIQTSKTSYFWKIKNLWTLLIRSHIIWVTWKDSIGKPLYYRAVPTFHSGVLNRWGPHDALFSSFTLVTIYIQPSTNDTFGSSGGFFRSRKFLLPLKRLRGDFGRFDAYRCLIMSVGFGIIDKFWFLKRNNMIHILFMGCNIRTFNHYIIQT